MRFVSARFVVEGVERGVGARPLEMLPLSSHRDLRREYHNGTTTDKIKDL